MTLHIESAAGVTSPAVACHGDIQQHKQAPANQQDTHHTNATSSDTSKAVSPQFDLFGRAQPDPVAKAANYSAKGYRNLPKTWQGRAAANNACIQLANKILAEGRAATAEEQASLMLFTGYGASDLANNCFRDPGTTAFRSSSWEDIGQKLEKIASKDELASLKRSTQYAHFTPEKLIRHMWRAVSRLGFTGGRVLEPGMGTGLFLAHLPEQFQAKTRFFGIEADPLTAKIARILFPRAKILQEDFAHTRLGRDFSLAIGNPPYSSMVVQNDPNYRGKGLLLHDYFILKSLDALQPGAVAAFVTSQGTMNKSSSSVRRQIAATCDLLGAIRLPEGTFAAEAGTNVGVDLLFFKKREANEPSRGLLWVETISATAPGHEGVAINEYFVDHPHMVLGSHGVTRGRYSSAPTYVCRAIPGRNLDHDITQAIASLPANVFSASPELDATEEAEEVVIASGTNSRLREGSYFLSATRELYQLIDGSPEKIAVKRKRGDTGIFRKHAIIIGDLIPIRDTIRSILATQERFEDSSALQKTLNEQYDSFVARHGPINRTEISVQQEADGGEKRETHRYPNLAPFRDDPDCWLVASIENYNVDTHEATKSAIFTAIVVGREVQPQLANASDALAVCLNARGQVDVEYMADLLNRPAADVIKELGAAIYLDPAIDEWVTADEYLSGKVRIKLSTAIAAAAGNPAYQRNVSALEECQPVDIPPSDITARLGSPWIPAVDISLFIFETLGVKTEVYHQPRLATWSVQEYRFHGATEAKARWETHRYPLHQLVTDALNSRTPAIHDTVVDAEGRETRVINSVETEAAKERLSAFRTEFERWIWNDPDRSVRLARIYNDNFNNLVARKFDGSHLALAGTNPTFTFYPHQKNAIWRQICNGGTYIAHKVGAGKTATMAAGIMEQKRLGLVDKPMLVVPNHCLGQIAIEYLRLYPAAKILVADEQNFAREKRRRFLARAATGEWDCIIITHSAFRFVPTPAKFEADFLATQIEEFEHLLTQVDRDDRLSRKRLEQQKEAFRAFFDHYGSYPHETK
ncbi:hypothetical protein GCM10019059_35840 [Camelimonas fluminis]|uniref:Site-specific DNA-methyltransferase (adenine-specific) n=1 Tax=Camelimonas fluminis TaxID=1576911 RepID=A0ABV7UGN1_9HYPH|nr:hypothetical protein [Camelimonas fluminis]GHE73040.1 hypothetical protein GCM10019059_35840 [Camelimonas fluminis]